MQACRQAGRYSSYLCPLGLEVRDDARGVAWPFVVRGLALAEDLQGRVPADAELAAHRLVSLLVQVDLAKPTLLLRYRILHRGIYGEALVIRYPFGITERHDNVHELFCFVSPCREKTNRWAVTRARCQVNSPKNLSVVVSRAVVNWLGSLTLT